MLTYPYQNMSPERYTSSNKLSKNSIPKISQNILHKKTVEPKYGQKVQYAEPTDDAPKLDYVDINLIQKIVGTFLY